MRRGIHERAKTCAKTIPFLFLFFVLFVFFFFGEKKAMANGGGKESFQKEWREIQNRTGENGAVATCMCPLHLQRVGHLNTSAIVRGST